MYRILLVDDEYLELQLLLEHIDWAAYGFEVCATALNGAEALRLLAALQPDVVITDIKMPVMDGIELSARLHSEYPDISIVFLTGYDQHDYLKSAITVDAVDFLLKPINLAEVPALLEKVRLHCDERRAISAASRNNLREYILSAASGTAVNIPSGYTPALRCADGTKSSTCYFTLLQIGEFTYLRETQGEDMLGALKSSVQKCCSQPGNVLLTLKPEEFLFLSPQCFDALSLASLPPEERRWLNVISMDVPATLSSAAETICMLRSTAHTLLLCQGLGQLHWLSQALPDQTICRRPELSELIAAINALNSTAVLQCLNAYYHCRPADTHAYHLLSSELIEALLQKLPELSVSRSAERNVKIALLFRIFHMVSPVTMCEEMGGFLQQLIGRITEKSAGQQLLSVKKITAYIDSNLSQPLSIDEIAAEFGLSANYFSTLFKRQCGCTVLEYLTEKRLTRAAQLLDSSNLKITQISTQLGYQNPSYFCALFAKKYGMTPSQYKKRCSQ